MHNCPPGGKWSIAVWDGASGSEAANSLATCGEGSVAAAYSLDPETGTWSRWFAGKPDVSNLEPLAHMQGVLALGGTAAAAAAAGDTLMAAQADGELHNCPPAGKWSIAAWEGTSGTEAADALATCGVDSVAAAYSLDAQTGAWSRWFAGKPDVSNLAPLGEVQGVLALGATAGPEPTPAATPTPPPSGPPGPAAGATYVGETSQGLLVEFDVAADGLGIDRVKFGFDGLLNGELCQGLMNMTFGTAQAIVDNGFTINDTDYTMTGRFDSATAASGDLQVHIPDRWADPGCFGDLVTWTASVQ
jgi:hypothetical protein